MTERRKDFDPLFELFDIISKSFAIDQITSKVITSVQEKAELWGVPREYHDAFIKLVLGTQNLAQVFKSFSRHIDESGGPLIDEELFEITSALKINLLQFFQTINAMVKDVSSDEIDEFMIYLTDKIQSISNL